MGWMGEHLTGPNGTRSAWAKKNLKPSLTLWEPPTTVMAATDLPHTYILGVPFFTGTAKEAVDRMLNGGLLVVPSAPTLKDIPTQPAYRAALLSADLVIPDSAYMVLIWNRLEKKRLKRLSGLEYLRELLQRPEVRTPGSTIWIMAGRQSAALNLAWLRKRGVEVPDTHVYVAPMYGPADGSELSDPKLLEMVARLRPAHVVVTVGGGTQERLGMYLRAGLNYAPGIHCIGAAIAFLSGDQASIPEWADHLYLGWLLRIMDDPRRYGPRYWAARGLFQMLVKYRHRLPPETVN
jgi:N-acetylglucosaminyldiphosphoundecaprenol N-acetyl-beta-D-mannosaminyltransferase